jgi:DNA-binding transcriptional regulator GbsR (MarR family)
MGACLSWGLRLPVAMRKGKKKPGAEIQELADQIGLFIQFWGFKKVHGRIWLHIFLAESPLDAASLIKRLGVSKALVSMSLKDLLDYRVIEECGKSERGTQLYRANEKVMDVITGVLERRERQLIAKVFWAYQELRELPHEIHRELAIDLNSLKRLGQLIQDASHALDGFIDSHRFELDQLKLPRVS